MRYLVLRVETYRTSLGHFHSYDLIHSPHSSLLTLHENMMALLANQMHGHVKTTECNCLSVFEIKIFDDP